MAGRLPTASCRRNSTGTRRMRTLSRTSSAASPKARDVSTATSCRLASSSASSSLMTPPPPPSGGDSKLTKRIRMPCRRARAARAEGPCTGWPVLAHCLHRQSSPSRHAPRPLFGAVCPERAVAAGLVLPYADAAATGLHLAEISHHVAPGAHAVVVLD